MKIDVPDGALKVISQLEDAGYAAFLVGGCIRDSLLGRTPKDWDICRLPCPSSWLLPARTNAGDRDESRYSHNYP